SLSQTLTFSLKLSRDQQIDASNRVGAQPLGRKLRKTHRPRKADETSKPSSGRSSRFGDLFDDVAVDTEESTLNKICSKSGDLGMADVRKLGDDPWVYLKDRNPSMRNTTSGG
ncbi:hypothetical protein SO802_007201, partial [Lithocarpus litseifolius]